MADPAPRPRFSLVTAVYDVARYLDEFLGSILAQDFDLSRVEVIAVDDGSTDSSLEVLQAWQRRHPGLVTVVTKPNGGPASARNAGLQLVRGEWVSFPDPDDLLDPGFLTAVETYLRKRPRTVMVATRRMVFSDRTGAPVRHSRDNRFPPGTNRLRNLDVDAGYFHGHAASSFFDVDLLRQEDLLFDERIRPTFEDGHFCTSYLLRAAEPAVGFVSDAEYRYRHRDDGSSVLDRSWSDPRRFVDVLEHGLLDVLQDAQRRRGGRVPSWVQGMVLYELSWYFRHNERIAAASAAHGEVLERFHELLARVCALLDETGVSTYSATRLDPLWRDILLHGYRDESWHTPFAVVDKLDASQRLTRVSYRFTGPLPDETFVVYGRTVEPVHQKIRDVRFFGRTLLQERIVWLPLGATRVLLDGAELDLRTAEPDSPRHLLSAYQIEKALDPAQPAGTRPALTRGERAVQRLARTPAVRRRFRDSWVLIDRIINADDSAEHLFRYLRQDRPSVNAWFVVERDTDDYRRIRRYAGHRVLAHGSLRWKLAMLNCRNLISSHIDEVIFRPEAVQRLADPADPSWRVVFLQHGVMKDDLSAWLNRKKIDVFVTSTRAEYESVVADHTAYRYTTRETKLTGLPRFDRILEAGNRVAPEQRDLLLVAPTWRGWLSKLAGARGGVGQFEVDPDEFAASDYARQWSALLNSPELRALAERHGLTVALLLHPNLQGTASLDVAPHVRQLGFVGENIAEHFARARVLVTDYSSMFFNAAYIERPVVYFQFDRDRVRSGEHLGRPGYFDYETDGFGPVTLDVDQAVEAVVAAVENGPAPAQPYLDRIHEAFPVRDGRCCERVADAISESLTEAAGPSRPLHQRVRRVVARRSRAAARRVILARSRT